MTKLPFSGAFARNSLRLVLLGTVSGLSLAPTQIAAQASESSNRQFNIPAQSLASALQRFMQQSGVQLSYPADLANGRTSGAVSGSMSAAEALSRLLAGTGLTYRFVSPTAITIERAPQAANGTVQLGTLRVEGASGAAGTPGTGGEGWNADTPYFTPAPTAHITAQTIDRFRGFSPADILRGTAGVMSGEARNSGSSIDVNIRGMQGFGRVVTTVDGAENAVTVYQGYQGVSNRTFVDPDFIGGIDITKGADASGWGNAGNVAMRTLGADDILKPDQTWGLRVKGSIGGNTSEPVVSNTAGYTLGTTTLAESTTGLDRPGFAEPTQGSASVVAAARWQGLDLVAGYAWRKRGNYHAGNNGGEGIWADPGVSPTTGRYINNGYTNYRPGEEVLNTQLETQSWLFKATAQFDQDHSLRLGYTGFRSEGGDLLASRLSGSGSRSAQTALTAGTRLDTVTARYRWNPADNNLFDLTANAYWTYLELRNPIRGGRARTPQQYGLGDDFRVGSNTDMWGLDLTNLSKLTVAKGGLEVTTGLSYRAEDTRGSRYTGPLEAWNTPRDAIRHEAAGFAKASYTPHDLTWLTVNAGLRYSHYWSTDRYAPYEEIQANVRPVGIKKDAGAFSPSAGITIEPFDGGQFYVNYSSMLRAPSVFESANAFNSAFGQENLIPERSRNWEIGANLGKDGLFAQEDEARLKLGYFNWDVKDYISRISNADYSRILETINIPRAKFSGLEMSGHYGIGGFSADLSANYFLDVVFCRTVDTCDSKTIYSDYATNHIQPEYTVSLTLSQKLLQDRVTLGGRANHVGPRAIGHGDVTGQGLSQYISLVRWRPHTLVDVFAEVEVVNGVTASVRAENLFDKFYIDPLGLVTQPGPGRTFYASLTGNFGGGRREGGSGGMQNFFLGDGRDSWTGAYAGLHGGYTDGHFRGQTTVLVPGSAKEDLIAAAESANTRFNSALFGAQAGYNWQLPGNIVLGVEADISKIRSRAAQRAMMQEEWLEERSDFAGVQSETHHDMDWFATLRARAGVALGRHWLVYGTGGLALTEERQNRDQYRYENDGYANGYVATRPYRVERETARRLGYTIGGGAEYAVNERFSLKADYNYSGFDRHDFMFRDARAGTSADWTSSRIVGYQTFPAMFPQGHELCAIAAYLCEPYEQAVYEQVNNPGSASKANGRRASNHLGVHAIKIGVNYRF